MPESYNIAIYGIHGEDGIIKYVGRTVHLKSRLADHMERFEWAVGIKVLEWATKENWKDLENYWISHYSENGLENKNKGGGGFLTATPGHRKKVSEWSKSYPRTKEWNENISAANKGKTNVGKKMSEGAKLKIGAAVKKRFEDPEERLKMAIAIKLWWMSRKEVCH
jgi:hypothetical protein